MTHYLAVNGGYRLDVECFCSHPKLGNSNQCPTGDGACTECDYCKVTLACPDFNAILKMASENELRERASRNIKN